MSSKCSKVAAEIESRLKVVGFVLSTLGGLARLYKVSLPRSNPPSSIAVRITKT
ncbi:MAG: hypothetical protein FYV88_2660 [Bacteroidetes bacterium]|nr:hypothetical protein [Bacteroidota bacterium]